MAGVTKSVLISSGGSGDMTRAVYDPTSISASAFDTDNHIDGINNKVYTATEQAKLSNIEASADVTDSVNVGSSIAGSIAKTTPIDADEVGIVDSADSSSLKRLSWSNIKATLKSYFDTIFIALSGDQTIADVKTFNSFPITPSSAPTTDYQVSNKKYVDDNAGGGAFGGLLGVNTETLSANKTLVAGVDKINQLLNLSGTSRNITLDTASATEGDIFIIRNTVDSTSDYALIIKQSTTVLDYVYSYKQVRYIFDGTNWKNANELFIDNSQLLGITAGYGSKAGGKSVAIGYDCESSDGSVSLGYKAKAPSTVYTTVCLGSQSQATRSSELAISIDGSETNKRGLQGLMKMTTNNTPVELWCGGYTNQRLVIAANTCLAFHGLVKARDINSGDCAGYEVKGAIKNNGGTTALVGTPTVSVLGEDDPTWGVSISADTTYNALKITVTGDATNIVKWNCSLHTVEG